MSRTFYFANAEPKPEAAAVAKVDAARSSNGDAANRDLDIAFWSSAQSQGDCDAIRAYLQHFPQGNFVELARLSERRLCKSPPLAPMPEAGPATQASAPAVVAPPPVVVLPPQSVAQQVAAAPPSSGKSAHAARPPRTRGPSRSRAARASAPRGAPRGPNEAAGPGRGPRPAGDTWAERRTTNQWSTLRWQGFDPNGGWNRGRPNRPCRINPGFG